MNFLCSRLNIDILERNIIHFLRFFDLLRLIILLRNRNSKLSKKIVLNHRFFARNGIFFRLLNRKLSEEIILKIRFAFSFLRNIYSKFSKIVIKSDLLICLCLFSCLPSLSLGSFSFFGNTLSFSLFSGSLCSSLLCGSCSLFCFSFSSG